MMTAAVNFTDQMVMLTKDDPHYFEHVTAETNREKSTSKWVVLLEHQGEQFPGVSVFFPEVTENLGSLVIL